MMKLSCEVVEALRGQTLVTAESCTGGGIGAALTAVAGSSAVYKGGIISYTNEIKEKFLGVDHQMLEKYGAVSAPVAEAMAAGVKAVMNADIAVSVTGLAGPGGDDYGNPVGAVYIGFASDSEIFSRYFLFEGDRQEIRNQATEAALRIVLSKIVEVCTNESN